MINSGPKLWLGAAARLCVVIALAGGCVPDDGPSADDSISSETAGDAAEPTTTIVATRLATTIAAAPVPDVPAGELGVVITQNREDPARNQFQLEFVNHTDVRYDITSVQFIWDGLVSPNTPKQSTLVSGQILDLPVTYQGARCQGDGTDATMPDTATAIVVTTLANGETVEVPVYDKWRVIRRLYLTDCERQWIDSQVAIEWVDMRREQQPDRPVTIGSLRLTRRAGTGPISVVAVSGTIPFTVEPVGSDPTGKWVTLEAVAQTASIEVRFGEARCDPHALAETKQPFKFVAQIDFGDGTVRPYIVTPDEVWQVPMLQTANDACVALGKVVFGGDG